MSVNLNDNGTLKRIAGGTFYADAPVGTIQAYGGAIDSTHQAPSGWLLCDGSEKNIDDFADLYAVIGDAFGTPSVNTKFVLPDLREATTKGAGENPNGASHVKSGGLALGEFIDDQLQDHTHVLSTNSADVGASNLAREGASTPTPATIHTDGIRAGQGYRNGRTTEVKAVGVNYIIKAKQTALPVDLEAEVDDKIAEATETKDITSECTLNTSAFTFNWAKVYKSGNVIKVSFHFTASMSSTSSVNAIEIPYEVATMEDFAVFSDNGNAVGGDLIGLCRLSYYSTSQTTKLNFTPKSTGTLLGTVSVCFLVK